MAGSMLKCMVLTNFLIFKDSDEQIQLNLSDGLNYIDFEVGLLV